MHRVKAFDEIGVVPSEKDVLKMLKKIKKELKNKKVVK